MMDVKQLRDTGELSDFTVYIGKCRFKLHKFPLYTKSEYFKEVAGANPVCELSDFPGGANTFSVIADFCYDKTIVINPSNIVFLRVGAEELRMRGKGGLLEMTKRLLDELLLKVVDKEEFSQLIFVMATANTLSSPVAARILEDSVHIVHSFLMANDADKRGSASERLLEFLVYLPLSLIAELIKDTGFDSPNNDKAYMLLTKYLRRVMDHFFSNRCDQTTHSQDQGDENIPSEFKKQIEKLYSDDLTLKEGLARHAEHFDTLFDLVKNENDLLPYLHTEWMKKALLFLELTTEKPKCRQKILRLAHEMLPKFSEEDLSGLEPSTLGDVVSAFDKPSPREPVSESFISRRSSRRFSKTLFPPDIPEEDNILDSLGSGRRESCNSSTNDQEKDEPKNECFSKRLPSNVTKPMIKYLEQKADSKKLTTDEFIRLLNKLEVEKGDEEVNDSLVKMVIQLNASDRKLSEQEQAELLSHIELSMCTTATLSKALSEEALPAKLLAEAAIKVAENEKAKKTTSEVDVNEPIIEPKTQYTEASAILKDELYKHSTIVNPSSKLAESTTSAQLPSSTSSLGLSPFLKRPWSLRQSRPPVVGLHTPILPGSKFDLHSTISAKQNYPIQPYRISSSIMPSTKLPTHSSCCHHELRNTAKHADKTGSLLSAFEAELRKELSEAPTRAYSRALCNTYLSSSYL
ncbi:hypothetical protein D915_003838 [Fasciola hepatica]|uniref:BTB domain-containing protein n=1 Tax=Fasciola hepatica TaxID=6192 RepID=A0A4E0RFW9_FASHE|nr:hypothetical protein D915_003838 [Fasciola hepatica]